MSELSNKTVLVTGASRGIGAAIAVELARAGATVVINYFKSHDAAESVCNRIRQDGGRAIIIRADLAHGTEIESMFDSLEAEFGCLDILVNNGAIEFRKPSLDFTEEDYDHILDTNLKGSFLCAQRALRGMKTKGWGRVINISSVHELKPTGFCTPYSISKGGLMMMMRELALEFSPFGITINNVAPGAVRTDLNREVLSNPEYEAKVIAKTPARFIGEPEDVAQAVRFLASPGARFITGTTLFVDGGLTL